jgi:hypothetical protein
MELSTIGMALVALIAFVIAFITVGILAAAFGVDSRPGIDDRDQRPWLLSTR